MINCEKKNIIIIIIIIIVIIIIHRTKFYCNFIINMNILFTQVYIME